MSYAKNPGDRFVADAFPAGRTTQGWVYDVTLTFEGLVGLARLPYLRVHVAEAAGGRSEYVLTVEKTWNGEDFEPTLESFDTLNDSGRVEFSHEVMTAVREEVLRQHTRPGVEREHIAWQHTSGRTSV
jgi:hypothetical protein